MRARLGILLAATVALGGCAYGYGGYGSPYGGLSVGVSSGYGGYGYGGYGGYGGYYDPYGYGGYGGYGSPYYGWYGDYYYPGTGYYVYDSYRRPHRWSDSQRRYWTHRRDSALSTSRSSTTSTATTSQQQSAIRENWSGFNQRDRNGRRTDTDRTRSRRSDDSRPR